MPRSKASPERPEAVTHSTTLPDPSVGAYTEAQIRFAASAWPLRAAEELRSARIFHALKCGARASGLDHEWIQRLGDGVRDEIRHAKLCAEVGARFGAAPPEHDAQRARARVAPLKPSLFRVTALLIVEIAMGETISTSQFRAGRMAATEPLTRAALEAVLRDEVRHASLGWEALSAILPGLPASLREGVDEEVRRAFAGFENQIAVPALRRLERGEPFDPAWAALGVIHPEQRVQSFYEAVEDHVQPRLARLGIDGARAWSNRYRSPS
jgi:hypothetical protein